MRRLVLVLLLLGGPLPSWAGGCRTFNGTTQLLSLGNVSAYNLTSGDYTLVGIVRTTDVTNDFQFIFTKGDGTNANGGFEMQWRGGISPERNYQSLFRDGTNSQSQNLTTTWTEANNDWLLVASVFDDTANTLKTYAMGLNPYKAIEVATLTAVTTNPATNTIAVQIGARTGGGFYFQGDICYVQGWNRALTQAELETLAWQPGIFPASLLSYTPAWGNDSPELDLSGNGRTATVTGATASTSGPPVFLVGAPE